MPSHLVGSSGEKPTQLHSLKIPYDYFQTIHGIFELCSLVFLDYGQGAGVQVHFKKKASELDGKTKTQGKKVDAQVCSILWRSIAFKLMFLFCPCNMFNLGKGLCFIY